MGLLIMPKSDSLLLKITDSEPTRQVFTGHTVPMLVLFVSVIYAAVDSIVVFPSNRLLIILNFCYLVSCHLVYNLLLLL